MNTDLQTAITLLRRIVHGEPTRRDRYGYTVTSDPYKDAREFLRERDGVQAERSAHLDAGARASAFIMRIRQRHPDIFSRHRHHAIIRRRAAFMAVCRFDLGMTLFEIGDAVGLDHSTVHHHVSKHEDNLIHWPGYAEDYYEISKMLQSERRAA